MHSCYFPRGMPALHVPEIDPQRQNGHKDSFRESGGRVDVPHRPVTFVHRACFLAAMDGEGTAPGAALLVRKARICIAASH